VSDKSVAATTITTCERTGDFPQLGAIKCLGIVTRLISTRTDSATAPRTDSEMTGIYRVVHLTLPPRIIWLLLIIQKNVIWESCCI